MGVDLNSNWARLSGCLRGCGLWPRVDYGARMEMKIRSDHCYANYFEAIWLIVNLLLFSKTVTRRLYW